MKIEWDFSEFNKFADNLVGSDLDNTFKRITKEISRALLKRIKGYTPVLDYDLINAWDNQKFLVTETTDGYEVLLVNKTIYATWVNDGHRQRPGRFVPGYWAGARRFVYVPNYPTGMFLRKSWVNGKFFVEKGIMSIENTSEIEQIIIRELQKWWDSL